MIHDYMCRLSLQPYRNSSYEFQQYQLGVGGVCAPFDPPAGYWCVSHFFLLCRTLSYQHVSLWCRCGNETSGGGAFTYHVPSGMIASTCVLQ